MIVVICPAGAVTGGPEALHQLVHTINTLRPGFGAICYTPFEQTWEIPEAYRQYDVPVISKDNIPHDAVVVLPEIYPHLLPLFSQRKAFWWLSVDNYGGYGQELLESSCWVHLAQSEYARQHVQHAFNKSALMLTDYINTWYTPSSNEDRIPRVAVNPVKGGHLIDQLGINNIKLYGMSKEQVGTELEASMVYIDFGHHPGRDRFPREACLSGAVVFTSRLGSAKNDIDIPIDEWFKFDNINELPDKVARVFDNYRYFKTQQSDYLNTIIQQQSVFTEEVKNLIELV